MLNVEFLDNKLNEVINAGVEAMYQRQAVYFVHLKLNGADKKVTREWIKKKLQAAEASYQAGVVSKELTTAYEALDNLDIVEALDFTVLNDDLFNTIAARMKNAGLHYRNTKRAAEAAEASEKRRAAAEVKKKEEAEAAAAEAERLKYYATPAGALEVILSTLDKLDIEALKALKVKLEASLQAALERAEAERAEAERAAAAYKADKKLYKECYAEAERLIPELGDYTFEERLRVVNAEANKIFKLKQAA